MDNLECMREFDRNRHDPVGKIVKTDIGSTRSPDADSAVLTGFLWITAGIGAVSGLPGRKAPGSAGLPMRRANRRRGTGNRAGGGGISARPAC